MKITELDLDILIPFVKKLTGIQLGRDKSYLFESRLRPLMHQLKLDYFHDLVRSCESNESVRREFIDAMTTGETLFFRDSSPFIFLQEIYFASFYKSHNKQSPMRIWSAASSSGQEVYSVDIVLNELLGDLRQCHVNILATDICSKALSRAEAGIYSSFEVSRGLSERHLIKYFTKLRDGNWQVQERLRQGIQFRRQNLLESLDLIPKQNLILCRNVAIYFSREDRIKLYRNLARKLLPDGVLIISSTESLPEEVTDYKRFEEKGCVFYKKK